MKDLALCPACAIPVLVHPATGEMACPNAECQYAHGIDWLKLADEEAQATRERRHLLITGVEWKIVAVDPGRPERGKI